MKFDNAEMARMTKAESWGELPDILGIVFGIAFVVAVFVKSEVFAAAFLVCILICWVQHKIAHVRAQNVVIAEMIIAIDNSLSKNEQMK